MTEQEYENIDLIVAELRVMSKAIYLACDAEVAADACLKTNVAIDVINRLIKDNMELMDGLEYNIETGRQADEAAINR